MKSSSSHRPKLENVTDTLKHVFAVNSITGCSITLKEALAAQNLKSLGRLPDELTQEHSHLVDVKMASIRDLNGQVVRLNLFNDLVL